MLKHLAPHKLLLYSISIWLFFFIIIPTTYVNIEPAFFAVALLILYNVAFLVGMLGVKGKKTLEKKQISNKDKLVVYFCFSLGLFGTILKFYQRFIDQGFLFTTNYTQLRMELMKGELNSGFLGLFTALLAPLGILSFLMILYYRKEYSKTLFFSSFVLAIYPIFESLFTQGRIIIVMMSCMIIIMAIFYIETFTNFFKKQTKITIFKYKLFSLPSKIASKKIIIPTFILGILFYQFSVDVVETRLNLFNYRNVFKVWERQQEMQLDTDFKLEAVETGNVNRAVAKYSLKHYFAHGVFEFIRMVNHVQSPYGLYYGRYLFNPYFKFLRLIGVPQKSFKELNVVVHKQDVYTTFWGPIYLDFGVFGILFSLIFGALLKYIYIKARKGYMPFILFYSYFFYVILGSMFLNLMIGSSLYIFNAILVIFFLYSILPNKIKI